MKHVLGRACGLVAMLLSLVSFGLVITALLVSVRETGADAAVSRSFGLWIYSAIFAIVSVFLYVADSAKILGTGKTNGQKWFNGVLITLILLAVPMVLFIGASLGANIIIWNSYHFLIFILEGISIGKEIKRGLETETTL